MNCDTPTISMIIGLFSVLAAMCSGYTAILSYQLSRKIQDELKSDERFIHGTPIHPQLQNPQHAKAVIQCTIFNKSKRKGYIDSVSVRDDRGTIIDVDWSDKINEYGNPQNPCKLIGVVDTCILYVRRRDGEEIDYGLLYISQSFSNVPMTVKLGLSSLEE